MAAVRPESFLDSRSARAIAGLVVLVVLALLAYLQREDLFATDEAARSGNPALAACITERTGHVATMLKEGVIGPDQAETFRARAIQFCEGTNPPAE